MTAETQIASRASQPAHAISFETGSLILFAGIAVLIAGLVALDTGLTGIGLFGLGGLLGAAFLVFQYGFASAWRHALVRGEVMGLAAHFLLIGLCALVFIPATVLGLDAAGSVAPVSVSLFPGRLCSALVCSWPMAGLRRAVQLWRRFRPDDDCPAVLCVRLCAGIFLLPTALDWGSAGPVAIAGGLSDSLRTLVNLGLIGAAGFGFYIWGAVGASSSAAFVIGLRIIGFCAGLSLFFLDIPGG